MPIVCRSLLKSFEDLLQFIVLGLHQWCLSSLGDLFKDEGMCTWDFFSSLVFSSGYFQDAALDSILHF